MNQFNVSSFKKINLFCFVDYSCKTLLISVRKNNVKEKILSFWNTEKTGKGINRSIHNDSISNIRNVIKFIKKHVNEIFSAIQTYSGNGILIRKVDKL